MPPTENLFSFALASHRERLGLTQEAAAALFPGYPAGAKSMSLRQWQRWEGEERTPPPFVQRLVLDRLHAEKPTPK